MPASFIGWLPFIIGGVLVIVALILVAVGFSNSNKKDPLADRLSEYAAEQEISTNLEDIEMSVPFSERVLLPIARGVAKFTTQFTPQQTLEKTERKLVLAGRPRGLTAPVFWVMRFGAMFGLAVLILVVFSISNQSAFNLIIGTMIAGLLGFFLPALWLGSKIKRRQDEVIRSLPDALDLMSICVEAGLGFDQAMTKVNEKWDNELAVAFGRVVREIALGKTRKEALRNMSEGVDVPDVTSFVGAIIQADQLGVSISKVLKVQAEQMRIKRRQRAQEKAQQAPVKMMIPMVLLIFPTIWIVLLGPSAVQLYRIFFAGQQ